MHGLAADADPPEDDFHPYEPESLTDLVNEFGFSFDFRMGTDQLPHARFRGDNTDIKGEDFLDLRDNIIVFIRRRREAASRISLST